MVVVCIPHLVELLNCACLFLAFWNTFKVLNLLPNSLFELVIVGLDLVAYSYLVFRKQLLFSERLNPSLKVKLYIVHVFSDINLDFESTPIFIPTCLRLNPVGFICEFLIHSLHCGSVYLVPNFLAFIRRHTQIEPKLSLLNLASQFLHAFFIYRFIDTQSDTCMYYV